MLSWAKEIFINAGSESGIRENDQFVIQKVIRKLTDPTTGELLMVKTEKLGIVRVDMVAEKIAYGSFVSVSNLQPARGDVAVLSL